VQTLATHKRRLDRTFGFKARENDPENWYFFDNDSYKAGFAERLTSLITSSPEFPNVDCCMRNTERRNHSSTNSYLITFSNLDAVIDVGKRKIKVDQPHMPKAEKIPLGKSPFYLTVNQTIKSVRSDSSIVDMTLFRLKFGQVVDLPLADRVNVSLRVDDCGDSVSLRLSMPYEKVNSDFIDVGLPNYLDAELRDFWTRGGFNNQLTEEIHSFGYKILVPTLKECATDVYKLLNVYDCPESKRASRELKFASLNAMIKTVEDKRIAVVRMDAIRIARSLHVQQHQHQHQQQQQRRPQQFGKW